MRIAVSDILKIDGRTVGTGNLETSISMLLQKSADASSGLHPSSRARPFSSSSKTHTPTSISTANFGPTLSAKIRTIDG
jgi:hypothetical protein